MFNASLSQFDVFIQAGRWYNFDGFVNDEIRVRKIVLSR